MERPCCLVAGIARRRENNMSATLQHTHDGPIERLSAWIAHWRRERAERAELEAMGCDEVNRMLSDCGVSIDDIGHVTNPKVAELLPEMLAALGVPDDARALATRRDLERSCAMCREWKQCESALTMGTAVDTWRDFCRNAPALEGLSATTAASSNQKAKP
jgi:uncharacterized protein YjiS (DUF1127 family)